MFREPAYEYSVCESKLHGSKMGQIALVTLIPFSVSFSSIQECFIGCRHVQQTVWGLKKNKDELDKACLQRKCHLLDSSVTDYIAKLQGMDNLDSHLTNIHWCLVY